MPYECLAADYIAGYIICSSVNCQNCKHLLTSNDVTSFIQFKNYEEGLLYQPTVNFVNEVKIAIDFSLEQLKLLSDLPNVLHTLQNLLVDNNYFQLSLLLVTGLIKTMTFFKRIFLFKSN